MLAELFEKCKAEGYDKHAFCAGLRAGLEAFAVMRNGEYFVGNDRPLKPLIAEVERFANE